MYNFLILIRIGIILTRICPSECGKLNIRSYVLTFALNIATLIIYNHGNLMVPSVNKFGYIIKNISFSLPITPSIKL